MKHHRFTNSTGTLAVRGTSSGGAFKSKLERHGFIKWFCHPEVQSVRLQEPRIIYLDKDGDKRRYTGDLLIHFHPRACRRSLVVECKYASMLRRDPDLVIKLDMVGKAMRGLDRDFLVQTEHDIHDQGFRMMSFVFGHRNNDPHPSGQEIMDCMTTHKSLTLGELVGALRSDVIGQCEIIPEVWRLVSIRWLTVNFEENLDQSAKINLPAGNGR